MISLEQIKELESRVHTAVARIQSLAAENATLKESLSNYELRIDELENLVTAFKSEQHEIEAGIVSALKQLDGLEDTVAESTPEPETPGEATSAPEGADSPEPDVEDADPQMRDDAESDIAASDADSDSEPSEPSRSAAANDGSPAQTPEFAESDEEEPELDIF